MRLGHTRPPKPEPGGRLFSRQLSLVRAHAVRAQARGIAAIPAQPAPGSAAAAPQQDSYLAINVHSFAPGGVRSVVAPIGEGDKGGEGDQASCEDPAQVISHWKMTFFFHFGQKIINLTGIGAKTYIFLKQGSKT
jgi:hypothetical protein